MEENELLEEENIEESQPEEGETGSGIADPANPSEEDITDQEILDSIRGLINENRENNIEGDGLLLESDSADISSEVSETIDYTQLLTDIKNQQIQINSSLSTIIEHQEQTIFDKPIVEYNIMETSVVLIIVFGLGSVVVGFIRKFTPKLWR